MTQVPTNDIDTDERSESTDDRYGHSSNKPTIVFESTFVESGEVASREFVVENESILPGHEPDHWPVLIKDDTGRLLLDTDDLRAVWTGPDSWKESDQR
jgi:hypothetical protein